MDEVDKIIIHSLAQIGCTIEGEAAEALNFTPEQLVQAVSTCLHEIKPGLVLPGSLPEALAQRFSVCVSLAEMCAAVGYRSDIGYQTFLYPNAVDVRRLFMFLIEQLPKDRGSATDSTISVTTPIGELEMLRKEIKSKILKQLQSPYLPQYCRAVGNQRHAGCSSHNIKFSPQLNLNIPGVGVQTKEEQSYLQTQAPSVFQQTAAEEYDLISSVLHKNAMDLYSKPETINSVKLPLAAVGNAITKTHVSNTTPEAHEATTKVAVLTLTPLEKLSEQVNALKNQNDALLAERKIGSANINALKSQQAATQLELEQLRREAKMHERTCVVLENPQENVTKLDGLIQTALERRRTLEDQWQSYRQPLVENLQASQAIKQTKNIQNVVDLRTIIVQLEQALREKSTSHAQLSAELKTAAVKAAPRKEYTRRILEFIGNIRKQRNDIYKVLDDTRDLQKQLNSVSAQLQRQFNYTDDLLFQSAKHDLHAKNCYKMLASLHATCNELVELVSQTGQISKEIRDLEVQIDREKLKNIAKSLEQISGDIRNFENVIKNIQADIRKVENEITAG